MKRIGNVNTHLKLSQGLHRSTHKAQLKQAMNTIGLGPGSWPFRREGCRIMDFCLDADDSANIWFDRNTDGKR